MVLRDFGAHLTDLLKQGPLDIMLFRLRFEQCPGIQVTMAGLGIDRIINRGTQGTTWSQRLSLG